MMISRFAGTSQTSLMEIYPNACVDLGRQNIYNNCLHMPERDFGEADLTTPHRLAGLLGPWALVSRTPTLHSHFLNPPPVLGARFPVLPLGYFLLITT